MHWFLWFIVLFIVAFVLAAYAGSDATSLSKEFPWQFRLAARMRTPVLMFIVVPMSFGRWLFRVIRSKLQGTPSLSEANAGHQARVQKVVDQVKRWISEGRKQKMRTARPNWAAMSTKLNSNKAESSRIEVLHLNNILAVDDEALTVTVEPGVTMGTITDLLLPRGLALRVQVEMESITVGGAASGFGMETNSHHVGLFGDQIVEFELVTADGAVRRITEQSDPEVFFALPWSHGTLGFVTKLVIKLVRVKPFVHVRYIPTYSIQELHDKMNELVRQEKPMFLEATIFTKDKAVIQCGDFADRPAQSSQINGINWWWKPFYYKWVETYLEKGNGEEYVPLKHYYHRFTRSIFWELEDMIPFSNHPLYRALWGWLGAPEVSLLKLFQGPVIRKASVYAHVVQESIMPISKLGEGIVKFDEWYGVYPLLVFPLRFYNRGELSGFTKPPTENLEPGTNYGLYVDLGAYGAPRLVKEGKTWDAKTNIRAMEHWTRDVGGWNAPYTDLFCTRQEFREMFNHTLLDKCRDRLGATDAFPDVYTKIKPEKGIVDLEDELAKEGKKQK